MDYSLLLKELEKHPSRDYWEKRIVERAKDVPVGKSGWLNSEELLLFIEAWFDISTFYARYSDTVIGLEVISEYVNFMQVFRLLIIDTHVDASIREEAHERLIDLDGAMKEIIKEAVTNLHSR